MAGRDGREEPSAGEGPRRTYEVEPRLGVAELHDVLGGLGTVAEVAPTVELATFFDTDAFDLARTGITLRRWQGEPDPGWRLTLPDGVLEQCREVRLPLGVSASVPTELLAAVAQRVGTTLLRPVVHLRATHCALVVTEPGGDRSAQVCEDRVIALGEDDRALCSWSEVAVEARPGAGSVVDEVERLLLEHGALRSLSPLKVAHVLPGRAVGDPSGARPDPIAGRLAAQVAELLRVEPGARTGDAEAVHQMRVAVRRLRSCLRTFRRAFEVGSLDRLLGELSVLGDVLGTARDASVLAARLEGGLAGLAGEQILGPVVEVSRARAARRIAATHRDLLAFLDGPRYGALLDDLVALVARPPFGPRRRSPSWYRRQLRRSVRRVVALADRAERAEGAERDVALHAVRRAAKHVRYAAETVEPVLGRDARRLARRFGRLQEVLGEHHDAVVARAFLLAEGARAGSRAGENAFTYGVLFAAEDARAAAARARFAEVWPRARGEAR